MLLLLNETVALTWSSSFSKFLSHVPFLGIRNRFTARPKGAEPGALHSSAALLVVPQ